MDRETALKIAHLAALTLTEQEVTLYAGQLGAVLDYVRRLETADVEGVEPFAIASVVPADLREDVTDASLPQETVLDAATDARAAHFRVPRVLGRGR